MLNIKKNLKLPSIFPNLSPTHPPRLPSGMSGAATYHLKPSRGFTLIELLVVIAIIGILSSIVLSSLNSARDKGSNAAVKADIAGVKVAALMYYDSSNHYGTDLYDVGPCNDPVKIATNTVFSDSNIVSQISGAQVAAGGASLNSCITTTTGTEADAWAVAQQLKSDPTKFWCVDSTGMTKESTQTADQAGADVAVAGGSCQ
ncbi:MAG: hypothetical protein HW401_61 [Parcubacteria group bacterium]|nr:hypothetical protein [Parcubacteria group bacterium]